MKLKIIFLILCFTNLVNAQSYEQDWAAINKTLESGDSVPVKTVESFNAKYKDLLGKYPDNSAQLYSLLGTNYSRLNNFEKSEENYLLSLNYAETANDTSLKYIVELSLAILNQNYNNYLEAEKYYLACMAGMAAIYGQSSREYTEIFFNYTGLLIGLGRYTDASPYVDALLYYYKTLDGENNVRYITLLYYRGIIFQNAGDYPSAIKIFENEVKEKRILKLGDTTTYVTAVSNLGDVYREAGYFEEGIRNLEKAKDLYQKYNVKDHHLLATIENNLALCYKGLSDPRRAEQAYNNALKIYEINHETLTETYCTTLSNKANLYSDLGRYGEASDLLWTAIEIRKQNFGENSENYANALANLANVFFGAGYYQKSLDKNLEANAIYKKTVGENHQSYANNLNSLSLCYLQLKNYKKAEECKLQALAIIEKTVGKDHYRYASFLISACELYRQMHQHDKAERNLKEALALVAKNFGKKHELYARAQFALAEIYSSQQKFDAAGPLYIECTDYYSNQVDDYFDAMTETDQLAFIQLITPVFESYNNFILDYTSRYPDKDLSEHLKRAFKYQMQLKSLSASRSAQVRKEVANSTDESVKQTYLAWVTYKTELINQYKSAETAGDNNALIEKISAIESSLKLKLKNFAQKKSVSYDQLRQSLSESEAAVEIFKVNGVIDDSVPNIRYGAFVATQKNSSPKVIVFKNAMLLDSSGFDHYAKAMDGQLNDTLSYGIYFSPFVNTVKDFKRVYVSSDGIFHKLSFPGFYNPQSKKYVADDFEIFQTANLGLLADAKGVKPSKSTNAVLFGYPDYDYDFKKNKNAVSEPEIQPLVATRFGLSGLAKLPGTKTEVEEISKELKSKGWTANVFLEQFASEKNVRKVNAPDVLHIATHGFYLRDIESSDKLFLGFDNSTFKDNSMLRSGLILAGAGPATMDSTNTDSENDGILTAGEAALLNLNNTDLVVLSACQTGLGDDFGTEGVAGLQRSFAIAGARNILMSLWPVDDYATQFLMTEFYKGYAVNRNVEVSFKAAQQAVKKQYPHPFYWAAFVLLKTFN